MREQGSRSARATPRVARARPRALGAPVASFTHRASGDAIVVLVVVVALLCLAKFGLDDDGAVHAVSGAALFVALAIVIVAIVLVVARLGPASGDDDSGKGGARDKVERRQDDDGD